MKLLLTEIIKSEYELTGFVEKIKKLLNSNSIILLSGDLAAGKTTFVANFCKLHKIAMVHSPTYSIHQRYSGAENLTIDHFDLYRLETADEVQASGFYDLLVTTADYKFIEWPERVPLNDFAMNKSLYKISIKIKDKDFRQYDVFTVE